MRVLSLEAALRGAMPLGMDRSDTPGGRVDAWVPEEWEALSACLGWEDVFEGTFNDSRLAPEGRMARAAKDRCGVCPVRSECLDRALLAERGEGLSSRFGVFGGLVPSERFALDQEALA